MLCQNSSLLRDFSKKLWRTIQKKEYTIQKKDNTIQKKLGANDGKILNYLKAHPKSTIDEIVTAIDGISLGGVKFVIGKLQEKGFLKRVGGRKLGEWKVLI